MFLEKHKPNSNSELVINNLKRAWVYPTIPLLVRESGHHIEEPILNGVGGKWAKALNSWYFHSTVSCILGLFGRSRSGVSKLSKQMAGLLSFRL